MKTHLGYLGNLRPTVNFSNYFQAPAGTYWGPRTIPDCQLILIVSGSASFEFAGKRLDLLPGNCLFYGSDTPHRLAISSDGPSTLGSIHFSWDSASSEAIHPEPTIISHSIEQLTTPAKTYTIHVEGHGDVDIWHFFEITKLESLFARIAKEFVHQDPGYGSIARGYLIQILTTLLRYQIDKRFRAANEQSKIAASMEAIQKDSSRNWSTPELAAISGYHPTYFAELFREATGYSPKHYLVLERVKQAQLLLLQEQSIETVAMKMGYSSIHYFCRNFKSITGLTPSEFKQRNVEL
ncbi:AraC-like ligand binding domain-containing protein [Paenibacillus sp. yr247]|uniref:helix-turn-helix domain-containing protein n=1 Tax=Paenibacillus sp. yr247 TaxID=1761880 RepID=UPI00088E57EC|nr:AraC family transcriptional regulator [Paenibacillus sp. yr247]SDP12762.1 AraC-like ligand binding domain-containing protein [Paenibacillus sp. yr247]